jgi:hypothetical protein
MCSFAKALSKKKKASAWMPFPYRNCYYFAAAVAALRFGSFSLIRADLPERSRR